MFPQGPGRLGGAWSLWTGGLGHSVQRVTSPDLFLPSEAFLIPAPYYGAITQHVYLYGNVRLVCVYLDSEVGVPETPGRTQAFLRGRLSSLQI